VGSDMCLRDSAGTVCFQYRIFFGIHELWPNGKGRVLARLGWEGGNSQLC
jgi:hypothetical protein